MGYVRNEVCLCKLLQRFHFAIILILGRIHKRLIDLNAPTEVVKQIIINIEAGVEVEVTIAALFGEAFCPAEIAKRLTALRTSCGAFY